MRSDDDSWDISTSVGATAIGVAALRAHETRRSDALFRDPYAALLVRAVGSPQWSRLVGDDPIGLESLAEAYRLRGSFLVARTCYFDEYFAAAADNGIRQMVILAAGLDARAYRLNWPQGTTVFELDQPKVLEFKGTAFANNNITPAVDRREVAVDLRHDWPTALRDKGFDTAQPTAWLVEGLLRYLPADAQDRLFDNIVALSVPGSRVAANLTDGTVAQAETADLTRASVLTRLGIDLDINNLAYSSDERADPRVWFADRGWSVRSSDACQVMAELGRPVPDAGRETTKLHILMSATMPPAAAPTG